MERAQKVLSQNGWKFLYHSVITKNNAELSQAEMYILPAVLSNLHWLNAKRGEKGHLHRLTVLCFLRPAKKNSFYHNLIVYTKREVLNSEALIKVLQEECPAQLLNK